MHLDAFYVLSYCRTWDAINNKYQFVLTGIVTGNPTNKCKKRALPDVFNHVGHPQVRNYLNCQLFSLYIYIMYIIIFRYSNGYRVK